MHRNSRQLLFATRLAIAALLFAPLFPSTSSAAAQPAPEPGSGANGAAAQETGPPLPEELSELSGNVSFFVSPGDATIRVDQREFRAIAPPDDANPRPLVFGINPLALPLVNPSALTQHAARGGPQLFRPSEPNQVPGPPAFQAGDYVAEVSRPGYRPALVGFTVTAGEEKEVTVRLKRESATLRLRTAPSDAAVLIEGYERGRTTSTAEPGFIPRGEAAGLQPRDFSRQMRIADLSPGPYRLEVRKEGFRSHRADLRARGLSDKTIPPIVLQPEQAVIGLKGLPEDASVLANGRALQPDHQRWPPRIVVPPGTYQLTVTRGIHGYFETSVVVNDRDRTEVEVELRPALAFLGVFGGDDAGRKAVIAGVEYLREQDIYTVLDRSDEGAGLFRNLGVDVVALRDGAATARVELDWKTHQQQVQALLPASLYFAAILNDDLVATAVDLWWWSAGPGPARPDVRTVPIRNGRLENGSLRRLARALRPDLGSSEPRFGASLIDSLAAEEPIVATVEPNGPAQAAGLEPGAEVVGIDGEPATTELLASALRELRSGGTIELETRDDDGGTTVRTVEPEWAWTQIDTFDPELLPAAAAASLLREIELAGDLPRWFLELNLATLLLNSGDPSEAIRRLDALELPESSDAGQEAVRYTLALALLELVNEGQSEHRPRARAAFEALESAARGHLIAMRAGLHTATLEER